MLKKTRLSLFLLVAVFLFSGCSLPGAKKGALRVETIPKSTLFLNGQHLGQTPFYDDNLKTGDYVLKIVPESSGQALSPWEGRVTLSPKILTVVNRELGLTEDTSSGEILSFEPLADKKSSSIAVVTTPDGAIVDLDGEPKGFAPLSLDNVSEGKHTLTISAAGFATKIISANTVKGHKLIASIQLARQVEILPAATQQEATPSAATASGTPKPKPSPTPKPATSSGSLTRPYVEINSPDTGWVRVRSEPSTAGAEVAKVDHKEQFSLTDSQSGWYKIEYEAGKEGWISGKYAEKFE